MIIYFFWIIFVFIGWVSFLLFDVFCFYHHLTSLRSILKTLNIIFHTMQCGDPAINHRGQDLSEGYLFVTNLQG